MNRPRNRQPRAQHNNKNTTNRPNQHPRNNTRPNRTTVTVFPTIQQVIPGASVSIVQKADQPTGREVQGIVQDVLTRGDHPRGIKVRLQDGRIGRVQRMAEAANSPAETSDTLTPRAPQFTIKTARDRRNASTVATGERDSVPADADAGVATVLANCPICGDFEGNEAAVSYHVQQHLDGEIEPP